MNDACSAGESGTDLPIIAMGQQHDQAVLTQPLGLAAHQKLVKDDLSAIGKVAKLRLPKHQRVWVLQRISQLKACDSQYVISAMLHSHFSAGMHDLSLQNSPHACKFNLALLTPPEKA